MKRNKLFVSMIIVCLTSFTVSASDIVPQTFTESHREKLVEKVTEGVNDIFCIQTDMCSILVTKPAIQMNVDAFERLIVVKNHELLNKIIKENPNKSYSTIEIIYLDEL
jgi:hypothetical protein